MKVGEGKWRSFCVCVCGGVMEGGWKGRKEGGRGSL